MTLQEALVHPNVVRFDFYGPAPKITNDDELIALVRNLPAGVRVYAVMDSGAMADIRK